MIRDILGLAAKGIGASVGSARDTYDNALADTINGFVSNGVTHRHALRKTNESSDLATSEWVTWFKHRLCLGRSETSRQARQKATTITIAKSARQP
jgi:hypothetical protein